LSPPWGGPHGRRQARDLLRAARAGTAAGPPLRCAVAGAANPLITRLLLERGAVPGDHDLYLAGSADDNHECLRLLLTTTTDTSITAATPRA
jgi:hypothetical protein